MKREACPVCQEAGKDAAGDNLVRYKDGSAFCFSCRHHEKSPNQTGEHKERAHVEKRSGATVKSLDSISSIASDGLPERGISGETCEKYGVRVSVDEETGENTIHYYPYYKGTHIVAYKQRRLPKSFSFIGSERGAMLFGQPLFESQRRKILFITEGELDCLSVCDLLAAQGKDWPVVSIRNGADANGTIKPELKDNVEFLSKFEKIVLAFDNDGPGETYAYAVADWLCTITSVGIMSLAKTECKDHNEALMEEKWEEWWDAFRNGTRVYQPQSIVQASEITLEQLMEVPDKGFEFPWKGLNDVYKGLRKGELTTVVAGSGCGKTTVIREITHYAAVNGGATFGYMSLEETVEDSLRNFIAIDCNVPPGRLKFHPDCIPHDAYAEAHRYFTQSGMFTFFDSSRYLDFDALMNKVRYFALAVACDFLVIDNLTLVAARSAEQDERKAIDKVMASLAGICESTGMGIILVNHLKRVPGRSPNNGGMIEIGDLRGSGSIEAFSNNIIAIERDQQNEDESVKNQSLVRSLKNRLFGVTGLCCKLQYETHTGRLRELTDEY